MKLSQALFTATLITAVSACASQGDTDGMEGPDAMDGTRFTGVLNPSGDMGHGGSVEAVAMGGTTVVTVTLDRGSSGGTHPWHVHEGRCGSGGGVVGQASAYPTLEPDENGDDTGTAELNVVLDSSAQYSVNIHQSASEMGTIVACANLEPRV